MATITKKGYNQNAMFGLFKKEAVYNTAETINANNFCSMKRFMLEPEIADEVLDDKGEVSGSEFATEQEILNKRANFTYTEERAKPNSVIGFAALAHGAITSTQDGAVVAYRHKITPCADTVGLSSVSLVHKKGSIQKLYTGLMANSFKLSGGEKGGVKLEVGLKGSGTRSTDATAFVAAVTGTSEGSLLVDRMKVFMEDGATISISGTLTQGLENVSSGTPTTLTSRLKSFSYAWENGLEEQAVGGDGVLTGMHYGRRKATLQFSLLFSDETEMAFFDSQTALAIEFDIKSSDTVIAETGALYPGFQLVFPKFQLKKMPLPKGGPNDTLTADYECEIMNDGTNPVVVLEGYNAVAAYLA